MKLIPDDLCYTTMIKADYGYDAYGSKLEAPEGCYVVDKLEILEPKDLVFDVYAGWLNGKYNPIHTRYAVSHGRWTTWARKI